MAAMLEVISEKTLPQTANPRLIAYCPSMDLVAFASTDHQVLVYRINGQRVYSATQKQRSTAALKVEQIRWKPNGKFLLGWVAVFIVVTDILQATCLLSLGAMAM